jgi:hypothetical protein
MDEKIEVKANKELYNDLSSIMSEEYEKRMLITPSYCANKMLEKGYRKESDTAREILDEAKKWVKAHYKDKVTDSFGEREMLFMEAFGCLFEYLKEKYEVK